MQAQRLSRPPGADALPLRLMATVWLPFACSYFLSYGLRNINAVLAPDLTRELALSATDLGFLTSAYFFAFALAQLPAGVLLDRYGPRRVNAALLLVAGAGCALHGFGRSFPELFIGRALVGLGVSVCLMSAVKAFAQWLPMPRLPLAINLLLMFGGLGAMVAAGPVGWALDVISWRAVFGIAAAMFVAASAFLYFIVPDRREASAGDSFLKLAAGFAEIYSNPSFWRLGGMMAVIAGTFAAVHSLWIGPWLRDVGGLGREQLVVTLTVFALAATIGFAATGAVFDWLIRHGVRALTVYKFHTGISILSFALIAFGGGGALALPLWVVYFFLGSGGSLVLAMLARAFSADLTGRVNTATNVLIFGPSFFVQWGIGAVLDQWPVIGGHYAAAGYQAAFAALLAVQLACYAVMLIGER